MIGQSFGALGQGRAPLLVCCTMRLRCQSNAGAGGQVCCSLVTPEGG